MNNSSNSSKRSRIRVVKDVFLFILVVLAIFFATVYFYGEFRATHFLQQTSINGIDCSNLTVDEALSKIEQTEFTLIFYNGEYKVTAAEIGRHLQRYQLDDVLEEQKNSEETTFSLMYDIDENVVREYLASLNELKVEKQKSTKDAYLSLGLDGFVEIVPEVNGTTIDFEQAVKLCLFDLEMDCTTMDFTTIVEKPEVMADNARMVSKMEVINTALSTEIHYILGEGELVLDKETITDWLVNGQYGIDIDIAGNIMEFLRELNDAVCKPTITYLTPEGESIELWIESGEEDKIDTEAEIKQISSELEQGGISQREPIYIRNNKANLSLAYVDVNIAQQRVRFYKNGECIVDTPCVTGTKGVHDTPPGFYYLTYKQLDGKLTGQGYSTPVKYWMPFFGNYGLHDAKWRGNFGGEIYKKNGSHGCVNLPPDMAKTIYENIDMQTPIVVH